jgi:hypothetical protein
MMGDSGHFMRFWDGKIAERHIFDQSADFTTRQG